jgi:peroxiredoxin
VIDPYTLPDDLPRPVDDGAADHLAGARVPSLLLAATDGSAVDLSALGGLTIVYAYPRTGAPGEPSLVDDWDLIPGARGCTPETCGFRDHHADLLAAGADRVYGLSAQETAYQRELAERLHLPFPILSDAALELTRTLRLPTFEVAGETLIKRLTLAIRDGEIERVWYPVFPPDRHAAEVLADLQNH